VAKRAWLGLLSLVPLISAAADTPRVLVVQFNIPFEKDADPNVPVANLLGQGLDDSGKLSSIIWGLTDPVFRDAALNGKIKNIPDNPKLADVIRVGRELNASYLMTCDAVHGLKEIKVNARLYLNGSSVWSDTQNIGVENAGKVNDFDAARSAVRTLVLRMIDAKFRAATVESKTPSPEPLKGQLPATPVNPTALPTSTTDQQLRDEVASLLKAKKVAAAVTKLREAVDQDPLDLERRVLLIQTLSPTQSETAAEEARRATLLLPEKADLRILSARAWVVAGKRDLAMEQLNQALVRNPEDVETRLLLAEIAIGDLKPELALPHLEHVIKRDPHCGQAFFLRAVCRALLGGTDGVRMDIESMDKISPERDPVVLAGNYEIVSSVFDRADREDCVLVRSSIERASVRRADRDLGSQLGDIRKRLNARITFLEMLKAPSQLTTLHERRLLAHKLLLQTLGDIDGFMTGDADALTDARMNLGEAFKQLNALKPDSGS
jgi:tetratricopeptide (TPR) repeat protein